jgi:hypothetical protein
VRVYVFVYKSVQDNIRIYYPGIRYKVWGIRFESGNFGHAGSFDQSSYLSLNVDILKV